MLRILFCLQMKQPQLQGKKLNYICYFDENLKSFCFFDFLALQPISSTKSKVIIDKIKEVLSELDIDISRTQLHAFMVQMQ